MEKLGDAQFAVRAGKLVGYQDNKRFECNPLLLVAASKLLFTHPKAGMFTASPAKLRAGEDELKLKQELPGIVVLELGEVKVRTSVNAVKDAGKRVFEGLGRPARWASEVSVSVPTLPETAPLNEWPAEFQKDVLTGASRQSESPLLAHLATGALEYVELESELADRVDEDKGIKRIGAQMAKLKDTTYLLELPVSARSYEEWAFAVFAKKEQGLEVWPMETTKEALGEWTKAFKQMEKMPEQSWGKETLLGLMADPFYRPRKSQGGQDI